MSKEMLSDQGRRYSSWRGTTRFVAALRQVIERDMQENLLELAFRGQPRSPFYMVYAPPREATSLPG